MHLVCQGYEGYHTFLKGRVATDVKVTLSTIRHARCICNLILPQLPEALTDLGALYDLGVGNKEGG